MEKNMKGYETKWDSENGIATCILTDRGARYIGTAHCHDQDKDFCSEKTGLEIAEKRAMLKLAKKFKNDTLIKYETLKRMYNILANNGKVPEGSYELEVIKREMAATYSYYLMYKEGIRAMYQELDEYIKNKATIYSILRRNRSRNELDKEN